MANHWTASKYDGRCLCGATYAATDPIVYDATAKRTTLCGACATEPADRSAVTRLRAAAEAKRREAEANAARAAEAPTDLAILADRAGASLTSMIPIMRAHPGIAADCRRHGIVVDTLVSSLVHLAAADVSRANCTPGSWLAAAEQCAAWGLIPTAGADTPVYLFCRDRQAGKLSAERTRYGLAIQLARALDDCKIEVGWVFAPEALLGDLAARIRAHEPGAVERATALRADLERRAGTMDADRIALRAAFVAFFDDDRRVPSELRPALARAGKDAPDGLLREGLRAMYAGKPPTPEQRDALTDYRMDLDVEGSSLSAADTALLAALQLPGWEKYPWYVASGDTLDRDITWAIPSEALWTRPSMDWRREDGCPRVWWASVEYTDAHGVRIRSGMELARDRFYERACAGKTVRLTSAGLLEPTGEKESHILTWHGEAGTAKALREWLKAHPTLLESARVRAFIGTLDDEQIIEGTSAPVVGREHLRAVRQLVDQGAAPDYAAEGERLAQREAVVAP